MTSPETDSVIEQDDRLTLLYAGWVLALLLAVLAAAEFFSTSYSSFAPIAFLLTVLALPIMAATLMIAFISSLVKRSWRRAMSVVIAPVLGAAPLLLLWQLGITPFRMHFELKRPFFEWEISQESQTDGSARLKSFYWSDTGSAVTQTTLRAVVFDESDEIALPRGQQSADWRNRAGLKPSFGIDEFLRPPGSVSVERIRGHWYLIDVVYN